jgi:hypothetical protein
MKNRSTGMMVLLYIVTLGFYGVYWSCSFQNDLCKKTGDGYTWLGHLVMILIPGVNIIYNIYWQYMAGKRLAKLGGEDKSVLYIVLCFVPFGILVNPFLMQSQANKLA